nr:arginine and ornithine succinyltransferase=bifunctional enzyme {N-terminal} [Pseudomonas aeruginosa, Peptide Partial, 15 aa] [Pseudomonas aeruginosa]
MIVRPVTSADLPALI